MNVGELNKGVVALLVVMLLGAAGYLWNMQLYKPALAAKETAVASQTAAQQSLSQAQQQLRDAQQRIEEAKKGAAGKVDDSVARLSKATAAVPTKKLLDDATIVLQDFADRSGIRTRFKAGGDEEAAPATDGGGSLNGATGIDLEFEAVGTYDEMMNFMTLAESTVEAKDGKLYSRGRLFNVVELTMGEGEESSSSSSGGIADFGSATGSSTTDANELVAGKNEIHFTVTVRMYVSSTDNAQSVGESTPDDAAANPIEGDATGTADGTTGDATGAAGTGTGDTGPDGTGATGVDGAAVDGAAVDSGAPAGVNGGTG